MTRRLNVLVVEDDDALRDLYVDLLRSDGHAARVASDGLEAMDKVSDDIDLIITDVNMPRMSGDRFLQELRVSGRLPKVPVLVITAFQEHLPVSVSGSNVTILRKPFDLDLLPGG